MGDKIVIGPAVYDDEGHKILSGNCFIGNSLAGDELTIDTLSATVDNSTRQGTRFIPRGSTGLLTANKEEFYVRPILRLLISDLTQFNYGEPVEYYHDDALIGKFYMSSVKRAGKYTFAISCISAVGLLDNAYHYGGIYSGTKFSALVADTIGPGVTYSIDPALRDIPMYGWLPIATRRDNLHQVLFAVGAALRKDAAGNMYITALSEAGRKEIADDRLFTGGDIDQPSLATSAAITEHAYVALDSDETTTLFSGESAAEVITTPKGAVVTGVLVQFSEPIHGLRIDNGTILESGVNYAVLGQSSDCLLTGQRYTHTTRIIPRGNTKTRALAEQKDNEVTVTDATLVSLANSENVADRMMAYFGRVKNITNDLVVGNERPGDPVSLNDPFDSRAEAFIQSMDITMSNLLRARTVFAQGYVPTGIGNYYTNVTTFTAAGTFTATRDGKIRIVLVGGGNGGSSGAAGSPGEDGTSSGRGKGGAGGAGGAGGQGGKVFVLTLEVKKGQTYAIKIGAGGIGAAQTSGASNTGGVGGDTTFGSYSSKNGRPADKGYAELFGGNLYALPGASGVAGGAGSGEEPGPNVVYNGVTHTPGADGAADGYTSSSWSAIGQGGGGGGAAAENNGGRGGDGSGSYNNGQGMADGGDGGKGASGTRGKTATVPGSGGAGGHGGGGGGGGGTARNSKTPSNIWPGDGGDGGIGGPSGAGASGIALIYY